MPLAITLSLTNIFQFISFMAPLLIVFFIIMLSILNNNIIKGLIFNIGLIITTGLIYIFKSIIKSKQSDYASPLCNVLPAPFTMRDAESIFNSPSTSSGILGFTSSYMIFPMIINSQLNPALLTFLIALVCVNSIVELQNNCTNIGGVIMGLTIGIALGVGYYSLIVSSGHKDLVYFNESSSNNVSCKKPGKQKFKCTVYKNGVPIR
jgi:hypothetical protein